MPLFPEAEDAPRYRDELERFIALLPRMRSPEVVGKLPLFAKSYQSTFALAAYRASVVAAKVASRAHRHFPCLYRPTAEGDEQASVVWKSIESSGRLGLCIQALPQARAIHLTRHPCGYVASVMRGHAARRFTGEAPGTDDRWLLKLLLATATGKQHGLTVDDLARLPLDERLAWRWVLIQEKILADVAGCERVLTVQYEDVCARPIEMTRRMFTFAGLDWQAQTERFIEASTHGTGTDYYSVFKNPQASADRWRSELSPPVIERIQQILRESPLHRLYDDQPATAKLLPEVMA
jgi:hypothetical protein